MRLILRLLPARSITVFARWAPVLVGSIWIAIAVASRRTGPNRRWAALCRDLSRRGGKLSQPRRHHFQEISRIE